MADSLAKSETAILEANARRCARRGERDQRCLDRQAAIDAGQNRGHGRRPTGAGCAARSSRRRGTRVDQRQRVQVRQVRAVRCRRDHLRGTPNVTADAAGICLKSGNAALLRGSSSAADSNAAVVEALQAGLVDAGLPAEAIQLVPGPREVTNELMAARGLVDVLIPRGGAGLIDNVVRNSQVPVIETGVGNCHLLRRRRRRADGAQHLDQRQDSAALSLQCRRDASGACRHRRLFRAEGTADACRARRDSARRFAGCGVRRRHPGKGEGLCRGISVAGPRHRHRGVLDSALQHIRRYSTGHSETIVTESQTSAARFTAEVDAAAVLVNASSRFVDGGEFGFGAEIGISTQKLHAWPDGSRLR